MKKSLRYLWIAPTSALLDRCAKHLVSMLVPNGYVSLVPGVLSLVPIQNTGAAFSFFSGKTAMLTIISIILIAALSDALIFGSWQCASTLSISGMWMMIGGGLGNLYDRIFHGSVFDFLRLDFVDFAIFNTADMFIVLGAIFTCIGLLFERKQKEMNE